MVHACSKCEKFKVCTYTFFGMIDIVVHICVLGGFCFYIAKSTKCANVRNVQNVQSLQLGVSVALIGEAAV